MTPRTQRLSTFCNWTEDGDNGGTSIAWRVMAEDCLRLRDAEHGWPSGLEWVWAEDATWRAAENRRLHAALTRQPREGEE